MDNAPSQPSGNGGEEPEYVTLTALRKGRCWTAKMIRDLLGEPDRTARNPYYSTGAPMRLYLLSRVEDIEKTLDVDAMRADREMRSEARLLAATKREAAHMNRVNTCDLRCDFGEPLAVVVVKGEASNLEMRERNQAEYDAYVGRCIERGEEPEPMRGPAHPEVDAEDRWAVNYLRHECTAYDRLLDEFGSPARGILRRRVHEKIAETYPELAGAAMEMID